MLDLVKKHLSAFSAWNWSEMRADLADDMLYEEVPTGQRVKGVDEYRKTLERWKQAFPDLRGTLTSAFVSGETVIAEIVWEGTLKGPLQGPFGVRSLAAYDESPTVRGVFRPPCSRGPETARP